MHEYRLSWDMPDITRVAEVEERYGKDVWSVLEWDDLDLGRWHEVVVLFTGETRMDQYNRLKIWAETKEQPIRNVRLQSRDLSVRPPWQEVTS